MPEFDIIDTGKTIAVALTALLVIVAIVAAIGGLVPSVIGESTTVEPDAGNYSNVAGVEELQNLSVNATSGSAIETDAGGYVDAPAPSLSGSLALAATAQLDEEFNANASYRVAGYNGSLILRYDNGSWLAEHQSGGETTIATAPAPSPTQWTPLVASFDDGADELSLWVNGSQTVVPAGNTTPRQVAVDLDGKLEEVRLWNQSLSGSDVATYTDDPVAPLSSTDHELRLLFDEGEGETTVAQYQPNNASFVGDVSWADGLFGNVTASDYETSGGEFRATSGGYLDGQPKAYLSFEGGAFSGFFATVFEIGPSVLQFIVVGTLVMAASVIWREVSVIGGGR